MSFTENRNIIFLFENMLAARHLSLLIGCAGEAVANVFSIYLPLSLSRGWRTHGGGAFMGADFGEPFLECS